MKKITMCREIFLVFEFLGIPSEHFLKLKNEHGGLVGLYNWCENKIIGK